MSKHSTSLSSRYFWGVLLAGIILVMTLAASGYFFMSSANAAADSVLSFNPASTSVESGQTVELDARITPGTNQVNSVELHFTFDQTKLRLDSITPSATFSLVLTSASINNTNGTASISLGVPLSDPAITTDSSMATLSFTALAIDTDSPVTYTGASIAAAEGEAGNVIQSLIPAAVTITAPDTTAPTVTSVTSSKANGSYTTGEIIPVTVNFSEAVTSTGNVTVTLETGTVDRSCTFTVSNASSGSCNYTVQAGDTTSDLTVKTIAGTIEDQAANAMVNFVPVTNLAASKAIVIDTTAPVLAQVTPVPTPASDTTPNYTFSSTEAGTITYGGDCSSVTTAAASGNNTVTFNALSVATHSNCTVRVTDAAGNQSSLLSVTSFIIDNVPPVVTITAPIESATVSGSAVSVTATASDNQSVSGVQFKLDGANLGVEDTSSPYSIIWNTTTVSDGFHTITAVARDGAGNATTALGVTVTVVGGIADTTAPIISAVAVSALSQSGATITWTTDELADTQVEYGTSVAYGLSTTLDATPRTAHSQTLSGLAASTVYHYRVISKDAADNTATSSDATFTTSAAPSSGGGGGGGGGGGSSSGGGGKSGVSSVPPPTNVSSIVSPGVIKLAWTNPIHSEFRKLQIVRKVGGYPTNTSDGKTVYTGTDTSFIDNKNLQSGITYYYSLFSIDNKQRVSEPAHISATVAVGSGNKKTITWVNPTGYNYLSTFVVRKEGSTPTSIQDGTIVYKGTFSEFVDTVPATYVNPQYAVFSVDRKGVTSPVSFKVASDNSDESTDKSALLAQIQSLLQLIAQLKAQLAAKLGTAPASYTFTRVLTLGMKGDDVKALQQVLNTKGYPVATTGDGSFGHETTYFGPATLVALRNFQCAQLQVCSGTPTTTGYGQTGPQTRAALSR